MAGGSFLALLDDLALFMDDVAAHTVTASRKTAALVGDDMAVNAEQVLGMEPKRELPLIWKVFKGSLVNKVILVPAALGLSAFAPWVITPLMMAGGTYLCFEGLEKVLHAAKPHKHEDEEELKKKHASPNSATELEAKKVKGAIRTDFILSAEIVIVSLGAIAAASFAAQLATLSVIGLGMSVGVYGAVAGLVKLDDIGLGLIRRNKDSKNIIDKMQKGLGKTLVVGTPKFMKALSWAGTLAMFLVGGGIIAHGFPAVEHLLHAAAHAAHAAPVMGGLAQGLVGFLAPGAVGAVVGGIALGAMKITSPAFPAIKQGINFVTSPVKKAVSGIKQKFAGGGQPSVTVTVKPAEQAVSIPADGKLESAMNTVSPRSERKVQPANKMAVKPVHGR